MFGRVVKWVRDRGEWSRSHRTAWAGMAAIGPSGLSEFQVQCETGLRRALSASGRSLTDRRVHKAAEPYISASISQSSFQVWIYVDQVNFEAPNVDRRFEEWDAISPAALIDDACSLLLRDLERTSSPAV